DDVAAAAGLLEALEHLPEVAAVLRPAAGGEGRAAHVEADRDRLAELGDHVGSPLRVLEGGGAEVDALRARRESGLEARVVADAARALDVHRLGNVLDDLLEQVVVVATTERCVEVDEVDPLRALVDPLARRIQGLAVARLGAGLALGE